MAKLATLKNPVIPVLGTALYFNSMKKMIKIGSQKLR